MKGSVCCFALYYEQTADGSMPGSALSMNAKIAAHKEIVQDKATFTLRVEVHENVLL